MRRALLGLAFVGVAAALCSCDGVRRFYSQGEVTLYDGSKPPPQQPPGADAPTPADAAAADPGAKAGEDVTPPTSATAADAPRPEPVAEPEAQPVGPDTDSIEVARIFELESALDELNRAIRDGLDTDGTLAAQRTAIERVVFPARAAAGAAYDAARRARLEHLRQLEIR